jgi:hypothetical protein
MLASAALGGTTFRIHRRRRLRHATALPQS